MIGWGTAVGHRWLQIGLVLRKDWLRIWLDLYDCAMGSCPDFLSLDYYPSLRSKYIESYVNVITNGRDWQFLKLSNQRQQKWGEQP